MQFGKIARKIIRQFLAPMDPVLRFCLLFSVSTSSAMA